MSKMNASRKDTVEARVTPGRPTRKAIITGLVGIVLLALIGVPAIVRELPGTMLLHPWAPYMSALAMLFFMTIVNQVIKLAKKESQFFFDSQDMVVVYVMMSVAVFALGLPFVANIVVCIASLGEMSFINIKLAPTYESIGSLIHLKDFDALGDFWYGGSGVPWRLWIGPIIVWTSVNLVILFIIICLVSIVRKRWVEHERLTFPVNLVILPILEATEPHQEEVPFWKNKLLYLGFIWPVLFSGLSVINRYYPGVPVIPHTIDFGRFFPESLPWRLLWSDSKPPFSISYFPWHVGAAYLIPLEISFSIWFFYLFTHIQKFILYYAGLYAYQTLPMWEVQRTFAMAGFGLYCLWLQRHELGRIIRQAITQNELDDSGEPLTYRTAVFGGLLALIVLVLFTVIFLRVSLLLTLGYFALLFGITLGYARMRAEAGFANPQPAVFMLGAVTRLVGTENAPSVFGLGFYWNQEYPAFTAISGVVVDSYSLSERTHMHPKGFVKIIVGSFLVASILGFAIALPIIYDKGMHMLNPEMVNQGFKSAWQVPIWFGDRLSLAPVVGLASLVFTGFLGFMRTKFISWPFHPIGYLVSLYGDIATIWGPFFIAWVIKGTILRYRGTAAMKKASIFFIGMVFGDAIVNLISLVVSMIVGV